MVQTAELPQQHQMHGNSHPDNDQDDLKNLRNIRKHNPQTNNTP